MDVRSFCFATGHRGPLGDKGPDDFNSTTH
jgi:hypothetical protein